MMLTDVYAQPKQKKLISDYEQKIRKNSAMLDSIKQDLEQGRLQLDSLRKKEGNFLEQLNQLEQNLATASTFIEEIDHRVDTATGQIEQFNDSLAGATKTLAARQHAMENRLRSIYKAGEISIFEIVLTSATITDMIRRIRYFQELNRYDRELLVAIDSSRATIARHTRELEQKREQLIALKTVKQQEQDELKQTRQARQQMLERIRDEKSAYLAMIEELESAQQELNMLLQTLARKKEEAQTELERGRSIAFQTRKGKLPWPVRGPVIKKFGRIVHPEYQTVTMSIGIDIGAKQGDEVSCVAPGNVEYIGSMRGYGKFVIANHYDEYLTIYAHLDQIRVKENQDLEYGSVVGTVGSTGSVDGAKLHFQVRKSTEPLDPQEWLEVEN
ncbi:MAG: murein hydrolase activator EnvC family protein [Chitinivibrionales bacterium]